jgi:hypothetical protein
MKKLIPYILAYLIVATGTAVYPYVYRHLLSPTITVAPRGSVAVVVNPGISREELVAKLKQVGLSEADAQHAPIVRPAPVGAHDVFQESSGKRFFYGFGIYTCIYSVHE